VDRIRSSSTLRFFEDFVGGFGNGRRVINMAEQRCELGIGYRRIGADR
jgi:hypothetical protein